MSGISIDKLRPHPSNNLFFDDLSGEDWEAFLNDVRENGIRDPLRVTTDFQVVCGHQRLRAAKELGIEMVPVIVEDFEDEESIERLLVDDNLHRRHLTPMQKSKLAATIKERWGIKKGGRRDLSGMKGLADVAQVVGESVRTTQRLISLNNLIPELKSLVDKKQLGTTFATGLSNLPENEQRWLYKQHGDKVGDLARIKPENNSNVDLGDERQTDTIRVSERVLNEDSRLKAEVARLTSENKELKLKISSLEGEIEQYTAEKKDYQLLLTTLEKARKTAFLGDTAGMSFAMEKNGNLVPEKSGV